MVNKPRLITYSFTNSTCTRHNSPGKLEEDILDVWILNPMIRYELCFMYWKVVGIVYFEFIRYCFLVLPTFIEGFTEFINLTEFTLATRSVKTKFTSINIDLIFAKCLWRFHYMRSYVRFQNLRKHLNF